MWGELLDFLWQVIVWKTRSCVFSLLIDWECIESSMLYQAKYPKNFPFNEELKVKLIRACKSQVNGGNNVSNSNSKIVFLLNNSIFQTKTCTFVYLIILIINKTPGISTINFFYHKAKKNFESNEIKTLHKKCIQKRVQATQIKTENWISSLNIN